MPGCTKRSYESKNNVYFFKFFCTAVIRYIEENEREGIGNGGQVLRVSDEGSGIGSWRQIKKNELENLWKIRLYYKKAKQIRKKTNVSVKMIIITR